MKRNDCIVVTGAGGLVGSAVVEHLRSQLHTCVIGLERADCDLQDFEATGKLFAKIRPAQVFHAAARVYGIIGNMTHQAKSFLENTRINISVIDAAYRAGVKKITVMGTNCVYPSPPVIPFREQMIFDGRPDASESAYGHAKRGMLAMLEAYEDSYGLNWAYLVSGNLFGPRDRFDPVNGHVIPSLIHKFYEASIDDDKFVDLFGDGAPERDFLYVKDMARIVHLVMEGDTRGAINIGSGEARRIFQVASMLCRITGVSQSRVRWNPDKPNGRLRCLADLSRLDGLGFKPAYTLETGLRETWDWHKASRKDVTGKPMGPNLTNASD
jgi:GDP-L-fucose synthase